MKLLNIQKNIVPLFFSIEKVYLDRLIENLCESLEIEALETDYDFDILSTKFCYFLKNFDNK